VRTNRLKYLRPYPTLLVNPDGSTITVRYHEPRQIIKLPFDLTPLSEEEKAIHLQRRKPKTRVQIVEDSERVEFDSKKYRKYMKK
jgi:large subunit ribosomal protein L55